MDAISKPTVTARDTMSINELPDDILLQILSYFGLEDMCFVISKVCERWSNVLKYKTLWNALSFTCDRTDDIGYVEQVRCDALLVFRANVNLRIMAEVSRKCLSTIWLVTDPFILLTVHTIIHL
jgi:hypothetical protein